MKSYFTSFELEEGKFKGIIYDATTNQILHTTKLHDSQAGATFEVNEYVSKLKAPTDQPKPISNSSSPHAFKKRTCCGG
jgi:hypothetical protein